MQDLYSTDPTQDTCPAVVDHAEYAAPTRQHELDPTDQECICPLIIKLHQVEIEGLTHVSNVGW